MAERILRALALIPVKDPGVCTICKDRTTQMQCVSCTPHHYICRPCCDSHRVALNPQD